MQCEKTRFLSELTCNNCTSMAFSVEAHFLNQPFSVHWEPTCHEISFRREKKSVESRRQDEAKLHIDVSVSTYWRNFFAYCSLFLLYFLINAWKYLIFDWKLTYQTTFIWPLRNELWILTRTLYLHFILIYVLIYCFDDLNFSFLLFFVNGIVNEPFWCLIFFRLVFRDFRYTDSVMNYQSMAPSASSFAQFYHQAVSSASAGVVGGVGDSLGRFSLIILWEFAVGLVFSFMKIILIRTAHFIVEYLQEIALNHHRALHQQLEAHQL